MDGGLLRWLRLVEVPVVYAKQQRIIHRAAVLKELAVRLYLPDKALPPALLKLESAVQVEVFQARGRLHGPLCFPADRGALEVVQAVDDNIRQHYVCHHQESDLSARLGCDSVHTVEAGEQRVRGGDHVLVVVGQHLQQDLHLLLAHCLHHEPLVVGEVEHTAGLAGALALPECLVAAERQHVVGGVDLKELTELLEGEGCIVLPGEVLGRVRRRYLRPVARKVHLHFLNRVFRQHVLSGVEGRYPADAVADPLLQAEHEVVALVPLEDGLPRPLQRLLLLHLPHGTV
mmetsp:Transcript_33242/g.94181  ORF Transcript_33242/g.94181 Transcript_33242/m.94181 type:complete len:288 (-) Transcript_33242:583-1446(-)